MKKTEKVFKNDRLQNEMLEKTIKINFNQFCKVELYYAYSQNKSKSGRLVIFLYLNEYDFLVVTMFDKDGNKVLDPSEVITRIRHCLKYGFFDDHVASSVEVCMSNLLKKYKCEKMYVDQGYLCSIHEDLIDLREIENIKFEKNGRNIALIRRLKSEILVNFDFETILYEEDSSI